MTEIVLALSNLLFAVAILAYFYFREVKKDTQETSQSTIYLESLVKITQSKDNLMQSTLMEYLKHNERLEKMILPQPVTKKAVQDILDQMPPMVPNDIEKDDAQLEKEQLEDLLTRIPIDRNTKVAFDTGEDDVTSGLAEEIISGQV